MWILPTEMLFGGMLCFQRGQVNKSCVTNFRAENFFNLKGIYLFAAQKDKYQEKVFRLRPLGYTVTRGKKGGVPPLHKAMAGQVEGEKDRSCKRSFSHLNYRPLLGTEPFIKAIFKNLQIKFEFCLCGAIFPSVFLNNRNPRTKTDNTENY